MIRRHFTSITFIVGLLIALAADQAHALDMQDILNIGQLPPLPTMQSNTLGGIVTSCPSCTQASYMQFVRQMTTLISQLRAEYYQLMSLKNIVYANGEGDLNLLNELSQGGQGTQEAILALLQNIQTGNFGIQTLISNYNEIRLRHHIMSDNIRRLLALIQTQHKQAYSEAATLQTNQRLAQNTVGVHQAVQVNNAFQGQNAASLQKISQLIAAREQLEATHATLIEDRHGQQEAAIDQFRGEGEDYQPKGETY